MNNYSFLDGHWSEWTGAVDALMATYGPPEPPAK
jgi:hypothetical protein